MRRIALLLCLLLMIVSSSMAQEEQIEPITTRTSPPDPLGIAFQEVAVGLNRPLYLTHAGDGTGRLFLVQQGGIIYVLLENESRVFLDLTNLVSASANQDVYTERGLLGLAFHPNYAENGIFFVNYTDRAGHTNIARYHVSSLDPNSADRDSADIIFTQQQPFPNHNGGHMAFGPDGYLYVALGDGGAAGDPLAAGQNTNLLLGSILRLDVDADGAYGIPEDNPFVDDGGKPEIWSYGWRNPWRFSFDRATGDFYIADVGQNQYEEVNFEPAGSPGGLNYGWNIIEGLHAYSGAAFPENAVMPIAEYNHSLGCSITGGYVYRGEAIPDLQGVYLYSDFCTGRIWAAYRDESGAWQSDLFIETGKQVSSFGEDEDGELYLVDYSGALYRIVPAE